MNRDFDFSSGDDLADLLGTMAPDSERAKPTPPASYQPKGFTEACPKCNGTGRFRNFGQCFACKGRGQTTFKTSPEARLKARETVAAKARQEQIDRQAALATFQREHPIVWAWLLENERKRDTGREFPFAISLFDALTTYGSLTERQLAAAQKCVVQRAAKTATWAANAPSIDASKIEQAFATARAKAARPGMVGVMVKPIKLTSGDVTLQFTPGSLGSRWEGMLFPKTVDGKKLGVIENGRFQRKFDCTPAEEAAVLDCAANPELAAKAYGKAWSRCGLCGRGLLNDESIALGMGPICREKYFG